MIAKARQTVLFFCLMINLPGTSGLPSPALAQSTRPGGQFQDRFKQLDRNGEERGKVWYFAGHCVERRHFHNTAWIYKGTIEEKP